MATQKQRLYIRAEEKDVFNGTEFAKETVYTLLTADMTSYGWIMIGHIDVEFKIPTFDMRQHKAKAIQAEMETVRAEFGRRLTELQAALNECLAIGG